MYIEPVPIGSNYSKTCTVFEIRIYDHLPHIDPTEFGLTNVPKIDPEMYYVTSGDAICKTLQLQKDLWELVKKVNTLIKKESSEKLVAYQKVLCSCASRSKIFIDKLKVAKGDAVFLETEWRGGNGKGVLVAICKNPRPKNRNVH